jgi:hypothetical protein
LQQRHGLVLFLFTEDGGREYGCVGHDAGPARVGGGGFG